MNIETSRGGVFDDMTNERSQSKILFLEGSIENIFHAALLSVHRYKAAGQFLIVLPQINIIYELFLNVAMTSSNGRNTPKNICKFNDSEYIDRSACTVSCQCALERLNVSRKFNEPTVFLGCRLASLVFVETAYLPHTS